MHYALLSLLALAGALLLIRPLRRNLLTRPVFAAYRKVLPQMSDTEREALAAGTVWWEGDLFCGNPEWNKLLAYPLPRLTEEEQSFLDHECAEACRFAGEPRTKVRDIATANQPAECRLAA